MGLCLLDLSIGKKQENQLLDGGLKSVKDYESLTLSWNIGRVAGLKDTSLF